MKSIRPRLVFALFLALTVFFVQAPSNARSAGSLKTYLPLVSRMSKPSKPSIFGFEVRPEVIASDTRVAEPARLLGGVQIALRGALCCCDLFLEAGERRANLTIAPAHVLNLL